MSVVVKAGSWLRDGHCEPHRVTKLGEHFAVTSPAVSAPLLRQRQLDASAHTAGQARVVRGTKGEIRGVILVKLDVADGTPVESVAEFVYHVSTTM